MSRIKTVTDYLSSNRRRIMMSLFGVIICAVSVGVFKLAALGVDPFQSLMSGLDSLIPIPFGTLYVIAGCLLFVAAGNPVLHIPRMAGIGTIVTAFFMGPLIEFFNEKFARPLLRR